MDSSTISRVMSQFSQAKFSRRAASIAAVQIAATAAIAAPVFAQDATPQPAPAATPVADDALTPAEFLFVQTGTSGSFVANSNATVSTPAADGVTPPDFLLTVAGHTGGTLYFSDRPERIFGDAPTQKFIDGLGFSPTNPPNAAIVINNGNDGEDILVVELFTPAYDADAGTLTYGASVLSEYQGDGLNHVAQRQNDPSLNDDFNRISLFIDGCSSRVIDCNVSILSEGDPGNLGNQSMCYDWGAAQCRPCAGISALSAQCNSTFPDDCAGQCTAAPECPTTFC